MKKISAILFLFFTIFSTVFAKRAAPPEEDLRPITVDGYEYSVDFYNHIIYGKVYVLRKNLETGKIQKKVLYSNFYLPFIETDVQWVLPVSLKQVDNTTLRIINEKNKVFEVDTVKFKVKRIKR